MSAGLRPRALCAWSSGKDSAWALHRVRCAGELEVAGILTTLTRDYARVSMHGAREALLDRQARALGLPCHKVLIPAQCSNADYEAAMRAALDQALARGITHVVFGDLFLEDIRRYREQNLAGTGLSPVFPLWGQDTAALAAEMIDGGLRARLCCVDPRRVPASFAGREFDRALLDALPEGVDPCGERGEFHTAVSAGPMFDVEIPLVPGPVVERDGFVFADFAPRAQPS